MLASHGLPVGPLLLDPTNGKSGKSPVPNKLIQIKKIITAFEHARFVLLGDDTKSDPEIYEALSAEFGTKIYCVYIRNIADKRLKKTCLVMKRIAKQGINTLYYKSTAEALAHSRQIGLIKKGDSEGLETCAEISM